MLPLGLLAAMAVTPVLPPCPILDSTATLWLSVAKAMVASMMTMTSLAESCR